MMNDGDSRLHLDTLCAVVPDVTWLPPSEYFFYEYEK